MPKLLIAASGTGGHIFPALAVADALPKSWQIRWLGVPDRLEMNLVSSRYPMNLVDAGGLQGNVLKKIVQLIKLLLSTLKVVRLLKKENIDVVFTTGGYIAAPAILAAIVCKRPILLHESNAMPGKVTRLLARFCSIVAIGIEVSPENLPGCKPCITGTPVRSQFLIKQPLPTWVPIGDGPLIVIMGGSQGALGLNQLIRKYIPTLLVKGFRVIHLTGENDIEVGKIKHKNFVEKKFCNEISALLQNADLAISRAGASALSELTITGTPAILIPYPYAKDMHQEFNAKYFNKLGAALLIREKSKEAEGIYKIIVNLFNEGLNNNPLAGSSCLVKMRKNMEDLAVADSHFQIIELLCKLV